MTVTEPRTSGAAVRPREPAWRWPVAGVLAGLAGLATSYLAASLLSVRTSPVVAVGDLVIRLTPGHLAESAIQTLGHKDKPLLVAGILLALGVLFAVAGRLARGSWWAPALVFAALAVVGAIAVGSEHGATIAGQVPVVVGLVTWLIALAKLTEPLGQADLIGDGPPVDGHDELVGQTRRAFVVRAAIITVAATLVGGLGHVAGRGRRAVEAARANLRLSQVTQPVVPPGVQLGVADVTPWQTPAADFYQVSTALVPPSIEPSSWRLRIRGAVDHEISLGYDDLLDRKFTEAWVTLNCVSNPVGGNLVGNAWWSGVRLADLLAEAGPQAGADAVLQTSSDGWTCGTPLSALTDGRNAMLVVAMNGEPLPIEHGFPVRTLVPGLYGYVSACKWVVDMQVTRFSDIDAYWTQRGWSEQGPVKMASRVDVPRSGARVDAGKVTLAGVAWSQHTGISAVEYQLDGGAWQPATLAAEPSVDSWVQWSAVASVASGDHLVRVRAVDAQGTVQTGAVRDVLPNGATGWAASDFTAA